MKLEMHSYVASMTTRANTCVVLQQHGWSRQTRDLLHFDFLVDLVSFQYFILRLMPSLYQWTDVDDQYVIQCASTQGGAFLGSDWSLFKGHIPKNPFWECE